MLGHSGYRETCRRSFIYCLRHAQGGFHFDYADVAKFMAVYDDLRPYDDAVAGLRRLADSGRFRLVALSNGEQSYLEKLVRDNIGIPFDDIISVEKAGSFKPHPAVYRTAARILGKSPDEILMVAAHSFDITGARACGYRGAYVNRYDLPNEESPYLPDFEVGGLQPTGRPAVVACGRVIAAMAAAAIAGRLSTFSALRHRDFRWFFLNIGVQSFGQGIQFLGIGWLIYDLTGDKTSLGLAVSIFGVSNLFFTFVGGVLADRVDRKLFLIFCVLGNAAVTLALAFLALAGLAQIWHVYVVVFILGGLMAVQMPARFALAADLVPREDMMNAVALHTSVGQIGNMLGPPGRRLGHRQHRHLGRHHD